KASSCSSTLPVPRSTSTAGFAPAALVIASASASPAAGRMRAEIVMRMASSVFASCRSRAGVFMVDHPCCSLRSYLAYVSPEWQSPSPPGCRAENRGNPVMPILNRAAELHDEVTGWRRQLHAMPEILYEVHETAAFVAGKLREFGCDEVATGIG